MDCFGGGSCVSEEFSGICWEREEGVGKGMKRDREGRGDSRLCSYSPWADPWHRGVGGRGVGRRIFDRCTIGLRTGELTSHWLLGRYREGFTFGALVDGAGVDGLRCDKAHQGGSHEGNECG